ncbi:MAG: CvpA family protein [Thermoguttaceae bacterium]|nr:CvpA family protein [Thermoguttaceae bacterium]
MENFSIQPYDVFMLVVLGLTTVFGAWKGMAWQLASLASLVVSAIVALRFSGPLAPYLSEQEWAPFAAMLILFLVTSLAIWLAFRVVAKAIDRLKLKEFDHQIGGLFGLAKGILLCIVITFFAVTLSEQTRQAVTKTPSGRAISYLIRQGKPMMPDKAREAVGKYLDDLDRKLNEPASDAPAGGAPAAPKGGGPTIEFPKIEFAPKIEFREALPDPFQPSSKPGSGSDRGRTGGREFPGDFRLPDRT